MDNPYQCIIAYLKLLFFKLFDKNVNLGLRDVISFEVQDFFKWKHSIRRDLIEDSDTLKK